MRWIRLGQTAVDVDEVVALVSYVQDGEAVYEVHFKDRNRPVISLTGFEADAARAFTESLPDRLLPPDSPSRSGS